MSARGISHEFSPVHLSDPLPLHKASLEHKPEQFSAQKHTFARDYLRSGSCERLLKVVHQGTVSLVDCEGSFVAVAKRPIKAGEVVERGVMRAVDGKSLDEAATNPGILRLGHDFMTAAGFEWLDYSRRAGPPFIPSGTVPHYCRSHDEYNVELKVRDADFDGFEFDIVATVDLEDGCPLVRKVAAVPGEDFLPRYAALFHMSEAEVDEYIVAWKARDLEVAAATQTAPDHVHEDSIREHARSTRLGLHPVVNSSRTATLPHPAWGGLGVFATQDIKAGDVVEAGVMVAVNGLQGVNCPYVFTWNKGGQRYTDRPNMWAIGSGNALYYNSDVPSNVRMYRFLDHYRYLIVAKSDIKEGEEVMHLYASSSWRKCFVEDSALPKVLPVSTSE